MCVGNPGGCVTTEDHSVVGGLGAVAEVLSKGLPVPLEINGINDTFGESGEPEDLHVNTVLVLNILPEQQHEL